jgi:hypothetical protein
LRVKGQQNVSGFPLGTAVENRIILAVAALSVRALPPDQLSLFVEMKTVRFFEFLIP